jgi:hypothetical protein
LKDLGLDIEDKTLVSLFFLCSSWYVSGPINKKKDALEEKEG